MFEDECVYSPELSSRRLRKASEEVDVRGAA